MVKSTLLIIIVLLLVSCKTKSLTNNNLVFEDNTTENSENPSFRISNSKKIDKHDLLFILNDIVISDKKLIVDLQYSGGCVQPHVFELVTNGLIDEFGNMKFYILHKTHNDKCKALLVEEYIFDLNNLYNLESNLLKTITINDMKELPL